MLKFTKLKYQILHNSFKNDRFYTQNLLQFISHKMEMAEKSSNFHTVD